MNKKNQQKSERISRKNQPDPKRWRVYALMLVCGLMLVSGFFFAGRQHFSSMDYGMKNSRLRRQIDELESEKRRLLLAREISLSPNEIKKAAKKAGMVDPAAVETEVAQVASATKEKVAPATSAETKSLIVKTSAVSPAATQIAAIYRKPEKEIKKTLPTE